MTFGRARRSGGAVGEKCPKVKFGAGAGPEPGKNAGAAQRGPGEVGEGEKVKPTSCSETNEGRADTNLLLQIICNCK
jgi:hypothetical protein